MLDQLLGFVLFSLGLKTPPSYTGSAVRGDTTESSPAAGNVTGVRVDPKRELKADVRAFTREKREQFQTEIDAKRREANERAKNAREAYRRKVATIRDTRKKALVEKIDSRAAEINANQTSKMTDHVNKMSELLEKIADRASQAKAAGKDVSSVETAIESEKSAIAAAQSAISAQAAKSYVLTITSESALRTTVGSTIKTLQADLKAVHETVAAARKAVGDAIRALESVLGAPVPTGVAP